MQNNFRNALILEDLPESQRWLGQALSEAFPGVVARTASSVRQALHQLDADLNLDIALVDLGLPDGSGVSVIEAIKKVRPDCICVVTSIYNDDAHVFPALRAGATGYLLKDQPVEVIVRSLRGIADGTPPISPAIARRMLAFFQPEHRAAHAQFQLTDRETEVLRILAKGLTQSECARLLQLSPHTVSGYVKDLYRKLNVCSRAEAALVARELGLV